MYLNAKVCGRIGLVGMIPHIGPVSAPNMLSSNATMSLFVSQLSRSQQEPANSATFSSLIFCSFAKACQLFIAYLHIYVIISNNIAMT